MIEEQILDFATWYSGMEREKVKFAYKRYLKEKEERKNALPETKCEECGKMCKGRSCHDCQRYW